MTASLRPAMVLALLLASLPGSPALASAQAVPAEEADLVSLAPPGARADFAAGVAALHNFWLREAADRFRAVQQAAPEFTLGYWGEALAQHANPFGHRRPPVDTMRAILAKLAPTPEARSAEAASAHERGYLEAIEILVREGEAAELHPAYARAMARLATEHPRDREARAFYARALLLREPAWGSAEETWPRVVHLAEGILAEDPGHPGALHYLIHALDTPEAASRGLEAAHRYAAVAEGASHAVHMPSHIYMQLGMWDEVIESNRDALATSRRYIERTGRSEAELDAHAVDFLVYALLQQGRDAEARELIDRFTAYRHAHGTPRLRWYAARWHHMYALETGQPPAGADTELLRSGYDPASELLAAGLYALSIADRTGAEAALARIEERKASQDSPLWDVVSGELGGALAFHDGRHEEAVRMLRESIHAQHRMGRPNETADPLEPPEELLGEMLLELGRLDEAEAAFRAGDARWPNRLRTLLGLARIAAERGEEEEARRRYEAVLAQLENADPEHPALREARSATGASPALGKREMDLDTRPLRPVNLELIK